MWVRVCQVQKENAVCRWRFNSVFNTSRISKRATEKERGSENEGDSSSACSPLAYLIQHDSISTKVIVFSVLNLLCLCFSNQLQACTAAAGLMQQQVRQGGIIAQLSTTVLLIPSQREHHNEKSSRDTTRGISEKPI